MPKSPLTEPFHTIETLTGNFVAGYEDVSQAEAGATAANERADALGIKTRYSVVDAPRKAE